MNHFFVALSLPVVAAAAGGLLKTKPLVVKAGDDTTLNTGIKGLHKDSLIIWSYGLEKRVLIRYDDGNLEWSSSDRFELDEGTGSLTIRSLLTSDGGLYQGQVINGNGSVHSFTLTVVGEFYCHIPRISSWLM